MRKICVFTGSRAEYGLLRGVLHEIEAEPTLQLQILASVTSANIYGGYGGIFYTRLF